MIKIGILTTREFPLLYFYIKKIILNNISNFIIIYDEKEPLERNIKLWKERTGSNFELNIEKKNFLENINKKYAIFSTVSHNSNQCLDIIKKEKIECLINLGTPRKLNSKIINSVKDIGIINIHPGRLPEYRGSSAVEWAIYDDKLILNTIHFMDEKYDSGNIIISKSYKFLKNDTYQSIRTKVYIEGINLLVKAMLMIINDKYKYSSSIKQKNINTDIKEPMNSATFSLILKKIKNKKYKYQI